MAQRVIQLLRSGQVYGTKAEAKSAITALTGKLDGEVILARYTAGTETKTLISVRHSFTPTGGDTAVSGWTFFDDPESLIQGLDKAATAVDGMVVTTVTQADGVVSETKANVKDLQLGGYSKDTSATGAIASTDTVNAALSKLENQISSVSVTSTDKTVDITNGRDLSVNIDGTTLVKDSNDGTISADLEIVALTSTEIAALTGGDNVREAYKLIYQTDANRTAIGEVVKIYKDSALVNFFLGHVDDALTNADASGESPDTAVTDGTGATALVYIMQLADGKYKLAAVDVSYFLEESEFSDGLQVSNHVVSVKVDSTSEEVITAYGAQNTTAPVLSVGANGVKVSNIQTAIDAKVGTLDYSDTAVAGQVVTEVDETNGVIAPTRANLSGITLAGFTTDSTATSAIADTDTVAGALNKLQNKADASLNSVSGSNAIAVGTKDAKKDQQISLNLDDSTTQSDANNRYAATSGNVLQITNDGLYLSEVWDCGVYA